MKLKKNFNEHFMNTEHLNNNCFLSICLQDLGINGCSCLILTKVRLIKIWQDCRPRDYNQTVRTTDLAVLTLFVQLSYCH